MRLFVAVEIDTAVARRLAELSEKLRDRARARAPRARITWVPADRLHFTLRFLGEVDDQRGAAIAAVLAPPLTVAPFDMRVGGVGAFPESGAPRVLWVSLAEGGEALRQIERELSARLATCGVPRDARPFRPHLTLARVREPAGLRSGPLFDGVGDLNFGASRVDAITLFESRLSPKGPSYRALQRTALRGPI